TLYHFCCNYATKIGRKPFAGTDIAGMCSQYRRATMKPFPLHFNALLASMAMAAGTALAQPKPASPAAETPPEAKQNQSAVNDEDKNFIKRAAEAGHLEVEASKLAEEKSESEEVKSFAQSMIKDHTDANLELETISKKKGVAPPL